MKRVTTVTLIWLACGVMFLSLTALAFYAGAEDPGVRDTLRLLSFPPGVLWVLGTPVVTILWGIRFFWWVTRPTPTPPSSRPVGYIPPPTIDGPRPQYSITGKRIR